MYLSKIKMNRKFITLLVVMFLFVPVVIGAITIPDKPAGGLDINGIIDSILGFVWKLFAAFSVVAFMISAFLFLTAQGEPSKLTIARTSLIWGIVGMIVALAAFSVPSIVLDNFQKP